MKVLTFSYQLSEKFLSNNLIDPGKNGKQKNFKQHVFDLNNEAEISLGIKKLKNNYSTDCDGLNNFILKKNCAIVPTLTFLVKKCFEKGTIPNCLKKTVVITIHKCGNAYKAQNYGQLVHYQRLEIY